MSVVIVDMRMHSSAQSVIFRVRITLNIIITLPRDTAAVSTFEDKTAKATAAALCLKIIQFTTGTSSPQLQLHFPSVQNQILSSCRRLF